MGNGELADNDPVTRLHYDSKFFRAWEQGSLASARVVVPIVIDLLKPGSVVDVGCGIGTWLAVFAEHGVSDTLGVDGHWVDREQLLIESSRFVAFDLEWPLEVGRSFDLAVSLEVAEHLSAQAAEGFVGSLVRLAPAVLFSAAIPDQGGADHRNEQWPEYWAALFARYGYEPVDCIRPRVWSNPDIEVWYAQNTLLYVARDELARRERLAAEVSARPRLPLSIVHPRLFVAALEAAPGRLTTRRLLAALPRALTRTLAWRLAWRRRSG